MGATPNIKSTDQIIGAFGTQTDSIKLGLFYADQFGRETGKVALVNSAAAAGLKYAALQDKLGAG